MSLVRSRLVTHAEYQQNLERNAPDAEDKKSASANVQVLAPANTKKENVPVINHYLFFPDNPADSGKYRNGEYLLEFQGKEIALQIKGGVVMTSNDSIRNKLMTQGFSFMYSKEEENKED